ncbi:hypothetical protein CEUSTIGMA_g14084.t1 [Chlamydomonas eustigma]|uniref:Uncharacterized protein n=1 Tax=Chlamydomonas eustigma TaxID=1157962 RepID=A0A250XUG3_9CHLO|nr:hypothetical protein CEUSTIGMA_g14084.t1 [Chlamydomonas eustigma]|eukprot:GAX86676.1 hypothetical protein CEUSTIGMA_g14084.t1 [Chlamydomonas eustigma]
MYLNSPNFSVLTLDDADETAMEEILASVPAGVTVFDASASPCSTTCGYPITDHESRNEAKRASDGEGDIACETEMIMPGRGTKVGQATVAKRGAAVFNLGLAFALQRKRAMRAMRRLARMAQIKLPLPQVRNFHTFGDQLFIHTSGALLDSQHQSESLDAEGTKEFIISVACKSSVKLEEQVSSSRPTGMEDKREAAEKTDLTNLVKGPFRYHRMTAYRLRVLSVISTVLPETQRQTLVAAVGCFEAAGTQTRISPISSSPPVSKDSSLASSHTEALDQSSSSSKSNVSAPPPSPNLLSDELYPKMSVSQAVARLPLMWENGESFPPSHLSHLEGPLSSRKRKDDGRLPLLIEVGIHYNVIPF